MIERPTFLWLLFTLAVGTACGQTPPAERPSTESGAEPTAAAAAMERPTAAELLRNGRMPAEGVLTGGQPTAEQLETLAELGYKTVINLRAPQESGSTDPTQVESLGMRYVSLPITQTSEIDETGGQKLAEALASAERPVVVHCGSGNRVGALFAMKGFYVDGLTAEEALALGRAAGVTRLEPVVRQQLGLE